jgi:hypothetical protein
MGYRGSMHKIVQRNFDCPESGERCTDPACTAESCREAIRLSELENAPREKVYNWRQYESARRIVRKDLNRDKTPK